MVRSEPDNLRVSVDGERDRTIALLSHLFAQDILSLEELERRMELAYKARSLPALREITRDLPTEPTAQQQARAAVVTNDGSMIEQDRIVAVMSETKRRGLWRPARHLDVWCVMSDTKLDLTEAQLQPGVTEIHLRAIMASVKVIVPPGVRIVVQPNALMATVDYDEDDVDQPRVGSGAPVIRITGPVVMAELKVRVRSRELLPL
jgi:hypothetical protein